MATNPAGGVPASGQRVDVVPDAAAEVPRAPSSPGEQRVVIVVSRDYPDLEDVRRFVQALPAGTVVIGGGARAVDGVPLQAARSRGLPVEEIAPDRQRYGPDAGYAWNLEMVKRADLVVAFWSRKRDDTRHTVNIARDRGVRVEIHLA
jgi:hypothetical protein